MCNMDSAEDEMSGRRSIQGRLRWSKDMEDLIIELWEENIQDYFGARKRCHLYKDMAETITDAGFAVNWTDVRNKIENLIRKYKQEKEKVLGSQGSPSRWRYFEKIHAFLSSKHLMKSIKAEEDEGAAVFADQSEQSLEDGSVFSQDNQAELLDIAREQLRIQREEQVFNREHRRAQLKVLKYIARSQNRLQSLLVQLLNDPDDNE